MKIEIIDYSDELKEFIRILNYEWLEEYFHVEEGDRLSLCNPQETIIDKGGFIFYVKYGEEIVGTVSLLKKSNYVFELGKMAVSKKAQGLGLGKILMEHCLKVATEKRIEKLILYSNTLLEPAIHLYRTYGFVEIELEQGVYERGNIKMEKNLI
ncbi:GNAT family N-acetyltransferase [Fluviicola taffensis]|uniref:GCN5-related N-acetyltransferase n=1 Tax=Fluviicola taffensis (strain DSM 16823 / NCIMB 13979 / RW262) TaxID=755732 RepID=F2IIL3_FLUTR|nr:GNAT family N-acetyltransferase [Fluviicola taffensis]AEA45975.1 GCN5-related N-acetyltransferase [Fluviicola taffensis DSM 16823]